MQAYPRGSNSRGSPRAARVCVSMSGANSSELFALSSLIGKECHAENVSFMRCKQEDGNPAACLEKGEAVCSCVLGVMQRAAKTAKAEVDELKECLDAGFISQDEFDEKRKAILQSL